VAKKRKKYWMGLHTQEEQDFARALARAAFNAGMRAVVERDEMGVGAALGYLMAIIDLADDEDAVGLLKYVEVLHQELNRSIEKNMQA
jgi:hypothetical protein